MSGPTSTEQEVYLIRTEGISQVASGQGTFTIPNGEDGSSVAMVDLGANYDLICIACDGMDHVPASTSLSAKVKYITNDTADDLYEQDDPSTKWAKGDLPTSGTLAFLLTHAAGVRYIQLILSNNASGGSVTFKIIGLHKSL